MGHVIVLLDSTVLDLKWSKLRKYPILARYYTVILCVLHVWLSHCINYVCVCMCLCVPCCCPSLMESLTEDTLIKQCWILLMAGSNLWCLRESLPQRQTPCLKLITSFSQSACPCCSAVFYSHVPLFELFFQYVLMTFLLPCPFRTTWLQFSTQQLFEHYLPILSVHTPDSIGITSWNVGFLYA